ncbi:hypothetical protein ACFDW2_004359 [Salmonella enterica]
MDEERVFSLSYEQLTRIAEKNIRECGLDNQSARCISELCHGIMSLNTDYCSGVFLSAEWFCIRLQNGILKIQL